jgi:hypothetical protein
MFWAETVGLKKVVEDLSRYAQAMGPGFVISPLLIERAAGAGRFDV